MDIANIEEMVKKRSGYKAELKRKRKVAKRYSGKNKPQSHFRKKEKSE